LEAGKVLAVIQLCEFELQVAQVKRGIVIIICYIIAKNWDFFAFFLKDYQNSKDSDEHKVIPKMMDDILYSFNPSSDEGQEEKSYVALIKFFF
jgi:hypothetical protein